MGLAEDVLFLDPRGGWEYDEGRSFSQASHMRCSIGLMSVQMSQVHVSGCGLGGEGLGGRDDCCLMVCSILACSSRTEAESRL